MLDDVTKAWLGDDEQAMELTFERELPQPACELWRALDDPEQLKALNQRLRIRFADPSGAHPSASTSGDAAPVSSALDGALITHDGATRRLVTQFAVRTPGRGLELPVRLILLLRQTGRATTMTTVVRIRPPGAQDEGPDAALDGIATDIADGIALAFDPA